MAGWMYWLTKYANKECAVALHDVATFYTTIPTKMKITVCQLACNFYLP